MRARNKLIVQKNPDTNALLIAVEEHVQDVFQDISRGSGTHVRNANVPAVGDLNNGEIRLQDGVNKRLYTKMDGTLYYVTLTAV